MYEIIVLDVMELLLAYPPFGFALERRQSTPRLPSPSFAHPNTNALSTLPCRLGTRKKFDYDNGMGSTVNRFAIDLYSVGGSGRALQSSGDCGTYVTSICDKSSIGCKDSRTYPPVIFLRCLVYTT